MPDGPAICTGLDVAVLGTIGSSRVTFDVSAPFNTYPPGSTVTLPQPGVAAGITLTTDQPVARWSVSGTGGSGSVQLGADKRSGIFDADLVGADGTVQVHVNGSWGCISTLR
jgi:hypothetical protein